MIVCFLGASRAVGTAMSNNPISIIVPCHRVIKSDGQLGNYAKGCRNNVKKWLLNHEGALETENSMIKINHKIEK